MAIINSRNIYLKVLSLRLKFSHRRLLASRKFHLNIQQPLYIGRERYVIFREKVYSQEMALLPMTRLS